ALSELLAMSLERRLRSSIIGRARTAGTQHAARRRVCDSMLRPGIVIGSAVLAILLAILLLAILLAILLAVLQALDALDADQAFPFREADEAYPLRVAPEDGDLIHRRAHQRAGGADQHDLLPGHDLERRDGRAVAIGGLQRDDTLAAPAMLRKLRQRRQFAVAGSRCGENVALADDDQGDQLLALTQLDAAHAGGLAPHRPYFGLGEANRLAAAGHEDDLALSIGERDPDQPVVVGQIHGDDAAGARARERRERSLLHRA